MIVSGVEYIKDVLFLCMASTGPPAGAPAQKKAASVIFDGETYKDLGDALAFSVDYKAQTCDESWQKAWERRTLLSKIVVLALARRNELRKEQSKPPIDTKPIVTKVVSKDFDINQIGKSQPRFLDLVEEVHSIFKQLKTVVDEITELEKYVPPAAAAGVLSEDERSVFQIVMTALGPWGRGNEVKDSIEMLVNFEKDMTGVIGTRDLPLALQRLRALVALEAGAKAALPLATTDDPAALLKKIQETEHQLKANKVILDEYTAKKIEIQKLLYGEKEWSNVVPKLTAVMKINDQLNLHVPKDCSVEGVLDIGKWRQEFDDRQVKIEAYAKTQLEVQKALYDRQSWDDVLPEIKILKDMCDVFVQQTPKVFNDSNTLDIVKWRAEYDRLVSLRDAMWDSFTTEFKDKIKIEDVQWAHQFKLTMGVFGVYRDNEVKLLGLMKVAATEILPTITALMKLRTDTFAAIPESCKKDKTVDNITECVGLWSAEYTKLVGLRKHIKDALLFPTTEINTDDQIRARCVEYVTDLKAIFDACAGTGVTVKQCPKLLDDLEELLDPIKLAGSVAQIETWKNEVARLTKLITDGEEAAKKAVVDAAGGEGAAAAAAEATRKENVRLTSELGACEANWVRQRIL
jgi:hypothetical protein